MSPGDDIIEASVEALVEELTRLLVMNGYSVDEPDDQCLLLNVCRKHLRQLPVSWHHLQGCECIVCK